MWAPLTDLCMRGASTHTCSAEQKIEEASKAIAAAVILELEPLADAPN